MLSSVNEWPQPRKKHSCVFGHVGHVDQPCFGTVLGKENGAIYLLVCFPSPASWWSKCIPQAFSSSQFQMPVQHLREDRSLKCFCHLQILDVPSFSVRRVIPFSSSLMQCVDKCLAPASSRKV